MVDFSVRCEMTAFPPSIPRTRTLQFTDADLAHALFVTGRAPGDATRFGMSSVWEFVHRAALVPAYVRSTAGSRLARSGLALDLDRSEKVNLSYSLGQALAAIFCEQVLSVDRMLHIDRYAQRYSVSFDPGRQRPDLFGNSPDGWVVAEAKGRSNAMESGLRRKLEDQKRMVRSISGSVPWVAVGCVAAFPPPERTMRLHAFDPDEPSKEALEIQFDRDRFALAYYEPFLRVLDLDQPLAGDDRDGGATASLPPAGVYIGLLPAVEDRVREAADGGLDGLADDLSSLLDQTTKAADSQFRDGSYFETSWQESLTLDDVSIG